MIIFVLILVAIICSGLTVANKNEFYSDYCSPKNTNTVNAIFSILIFLSHAVTYVDLNGTFDAPYFTLRKFLGQLVVITYLFFSGYGIMESIKKKGTSYVKQMPVNRFFKLWYHFAIVIVLYTIVSVGILGKEYTLSHYLLSYTGYTTLGNSNWYMFVTFAMYIIVIVSFLVFKKSKVLAVVAVWVLSIAFVIWEQYMELPVQYYNTVRCFPAGMMFSLVKPYIDKILMKNDIFWFSGFTLSVAGFAYFSQNRNDSQIHYGLFILFALAVIVVGMMKINVKSSVLDWFGQHIFSFFILQRIPMLLARHLGYARNGIIFILITFFGTLFLSVIFDAAMDKLDSIVFKKRKKLKA